eukprot:gene34836-42187_t
MTKLLLVIMFALTSALRVHLRSPRRLLNVLSLSISNKSVVGDEKVAKVRQLMTELNLDAIVIPTDDPHMSEYTAPYYGRREFVSGFTGSAGTAIITHSMAALFTDGRYFTQAEMELSASWTLMRSGLKDVPTTTEFLVQHLSAGQRVGIDPFVHSAQNTMQLRQALDAKMISLVNMQSHPVDAIWSDRPGVPVSQIREHPLEYAGKSREEKIATLRVEMKAQGADAIVLSALDEIMWLYNIRGQDVPCNPVSICYALITSSAAYLFINPAKVPAPVRGALEQAGVGLLNYEELPAQLRDTRGRVWMDSKTLNAAVYNLVEAARRLDAPSPVILWKALKNAAEIHAMQRCHVRDGAAVAACLCALEKKVQAGEEVSEVQIDHMLRDYRARYGEGKFLEPSFDTIAGVNANAAIIHYRAKEGKCSRLRKGDLLLLDSGAQYIDGTTDVTRTLHFGEPSEYQKEMYTRVLQGHIAIATAVFPSHTPGCLLDSLARRALWRAGRVFQHGVGHGVGAALNVHEGPHSISAKLENTTPLQENMIVSNEPGYYEQGKFGIRIENLLLLRKAHPRPLSSSSGSGAHEASSSTPLGVDFLTFQPLTLIPIQKKMILPDILTEEERQYLNTYHSNVRELVSPLLLSDEERQWLIDATDPI